MHCFPLEDLFPGNFVREFVTWNQMPQILIPLMRLHHLHLSLSMPKPNYKQDGAGDNLTECTALATIWVLCLPSFSSGPVEYLEYSHIMSATCQVFQTKNAQFLEWFQNSGGGLHDAVGIAHFEDTGRGAIALEDIAVRSNYSSEVGWPY